MTNGSSPKRFTFIVAISVGIVTLVTALLGLAYNAMSLFAAFSGAFDQMPDKASMPYFETAFYVMSGICIACYLAMVYCAIGLFRHSRQTGRLLSLILLFEVGFFFAVGSMWREPTVGSSVAAATGVANGGMMAQFVILFPIWAPLALWVSGLLRSPAHDFPSSRTDAETQCAN